MRIYNNSTTVRIRVVVKERTNLKREYGLFDKRMGKNSSTYPIRMPIQAVRNHDKPLVYTAQVNNSRQTERYVERAKTSSLLDSKKPVIVGTKV